MTQIFFRVEPRSWIDYWTIEPVDFFQFSVSLQILWSFKWPFINKIQLHSLRDILNFDKMW